MWTIDAIKVVTLLANFAIALASLQVTPLSRDNDKDLESERPTDCAADQYYDIKETSCKNCSDLNQLFHSHQEWIGREVSELRQDEGQNGFSNSKRRKLTPQANLNSNNRISTSGSTYGASGSSNNNDVLSRLISADSRNQGFSEPVGDQLDLGDGDADYVTESVDSTDTIKTPLKQTLRLVNRFVQSSLVGDELPEAITQCRQNQNFSACQMWSNFCVLSMYSHSDPTIGQLHSAHEISQSSKKTSWQKCPQFSATSVCNSYRDWFRMERKSGNEMQNIFANEDSLVKFGSSISLHVNQQIQLLAYKYSFSGNLLGVDQFDSNDLERFCAISRDDQLVTRQKGNGFVRVGENLQYKCRFDATQVVALLSNRPINETVFVDLFIGYSSNGAAFVKPVPVLVKNLLHNGMQSNRKFAKDSSRWKLVYRFFFHANLLLEDNIDDQSRFSKVGGDEILIYPSSAVLDLKFKRQDRGVSLSSILLSLDYSHVSLTEELWRSNSSNYLPTPLATDISVTQTLIDMSSYKKDLDLIMTILSILSSIWSLIKCYNLQKYYGSVKLDFSSLFTFVIISCDTIANLFAIVTFIFLGCIFSSVKLQFPSQMLPPSEELESSLIMNLELALLFKMFGILHKVYIQLTADTFFIDWEKPKMLTSSQIVNHSMYYDRSKEKDRNGHGHSAMHELQQSSFWRPYTIINRWIQMQTLRRQNMELQLFLFVLLVEVTNLTDLSTADGSLDATAWEHTSLANEPPSDSNNHLAPLTSVPFRMLILSSIYFTLAFGQILYQKYLHEPMVRSMLHEFVDLCSVANVSLFSMLYPRFGYYIHGRNANGSGDCSITEMNALLEREERDLCTKRGLAPNSDHQTFKFILPRIINDHYRKLLFTDTPTASSSTSGAQMNKQLAPSLSQLSSSKLNRNILLGSAFKSSASMSSFGSNRAFIETIMARSKAINMFLINFLEHTYKDIDYSIRRSRRFESFLLDVDFDEETSTTRNGPLSSVALDKSQPGATFCIDVNDSFTSLLWLGLEWDFVLMELLTILILDLWFGQQPLIVTASLLWLLHQAFKAVYAHCARQNLTTKSLLDEKFLIR